MSQVCTVDLYDVFCSESEGFAQALTELDGSSTDLTNMKKSLLSAF